MPESCSSRLENSNRFPRGQAVQNVRTEVYSVRPDDCPRLGVHLNLLEKLYVLQLTEHSPAADDPLPEIDYPRRTISETQFQEIVAYVPDLLDPRKHDPLPYTPTPTLHSRYPTACLT